jgi:alkenylglycerophosphocholine/alkenylglycerophosphoethanolamine hydrolase
MPGFVFALLAAGLDLLAVALGWHAIRVLTKPLAALILAVLAWRTGTRPCRILGAGLVLAATGDELLLRSDSASFMAGMGAFALMQIAYVAAFLASGSSLFPRVRPQWPFFGFLAVFLLWAWADAWIVPAAGSMKVPVAIYSVLLLLMVSNASQLQKHGLVTLGAIVFMFSDLTLASAKFLPAFPLAPRSTELVVMGTYFAAQLLIAWGMTHAGPQPGANDRALARGQR